MSEFSIIDYNNARNQAQAGNVAEAYNTLQRSGAPTAAYQAIFPNATQNGQPAFQSSGGGNTNVGDLVNQITTPTVSIPSLDYTPPSSADIQGKWKEFLDRAAKDPDIVNYYQTLLDQAKGDTTLAISALEKL